MCPAREEAETAPVSELVARASRRPTNYTRTAFHMTSGVVSLSALLLLPGRVWVFAIAGSLAVVCWTLEILRRTRPALNEKLMGLFRHIAHGEERHKVNSSTWYATALALMAAGAPTLPSALGVVVLASADPAAGFFGRRFGRTHLLEGRSLEGTLAFFAVGAITAFLTALFVSDSSPLSALALAVVAGATGAIAELFSRRLDDNFTVPVVVTFATTLALPLCLA